MEKYIVIGTPWLLSCNCSVAAWTLAGLRFSYHTDLLWGLARTARLSLNSHRRLKHLLIALRLKFQRLGQCDCLYLPNCPNKDTPHYKLVPTWQGLCVANVIRSQQLWRQRAAAIGNDSPCVAAMDTSIWDRDHLTHMPLCAMDSSACSVELIGEVFNHSLRDALASHPTLLSLCPNLHVEVRLKLSWRPSMGGPENFKGHWPEIRRFQPNLGFLDLLCNLGGLKSQLCLHQHFVYSN